MTATDLAWLTYAMLVPTTGILGFSTVIIGIAERRDRAVHAGLALCGLCTAALLGPLAHALGPG